MKFPQPKLNNKKSENRKLVRQNYIMNNHGVEAFFEELRILSLETARKRLIAPEVERLRNLAFSDSLKLNAVVVVYFFSWLIFKKKK